MTRDGWKNVSLPADLYEACRARVGTQGFRSLAEVVATAVRNFLFPIGSSFPSPPVVDHVPSPSDGGGRSPRADAAPEEKGVPSGSPGHPEAASRGGHRSKRTRGREDGPTQDGPDPSTGSSGDPPVSVSREAAGAGAAANADAPAPVELVAASVEAAVGKHVDVRALRNWIHGKLRDLRDAEDPRAMAVDLVRVAVSLQGLAMPDEHVAAALLEELVQVDKEIRAVVS